MGYCSVTSQFDLALTLTNLIIRNFMNTRTIVKAAVPSLLKSYACFAVCNQKLISSVHPLRGHLSVIMQTWLLHAHVARLLAIVGIISIALALLHLFGHPYLNYFSILSHVDVGLVSQVYSNNSKSSISYVNHDHNNSGEKFEIDEGNLYHVSTSERPSLVNTNKSSFLSSNSSLMASNRPALRKRGAKAVSITMMNSIYQKNSAEMKSKRQRLSSQRDQELIYAKFQIENAPIERSVSEAHSSLFRNYSMFKRSYELMESTLKVYVYREGEKPNFHLPKLRGIYASEGWFMKSVEKNKQFVVKNPKKAHLFYLPFSTLRLRNYLNGSSFISQKMENHLKNYIDIIATKYRFWNKSEGSDHFLVACHDWAPRVTRNIFGNCLRVLCNSNIARGFRIGKDVSFPVTYISSANNPLKNLGGNPPSKRPILAFFAGGMHGYVRPILLQYWQNKNSDMKIMGPMSRDDEGKEKYREYMKSSKYCICAKGYEVHTPRVVESIHFECVPVIISDNYVPPFFEVLNWEEFALFILEDDIPNLRDILLSVPEDRYIMMQRRIRIVQRYFLWHKVPVKYDLFHMILHSVWFNRVFHF